MLHVDNLSVRFSTPDGDVAAVNGLSFDLAAGQTLGLVGESGSGKSQTALALMGLLASNGKVAGSVQFDGQELVGRKDWRGLRGDKIGMIFQDPMTCLNPYLSIGAQMAEVLEFHRGSSREAAWAESQRLLEAVNVSDAQKRLKQFPHEFSGGMRQRVMIAMTLLTQPKLLIADEPTTALDVTVQAQILSLLAQLRRDFGLSILLITHDLGIVAEVCDEVLVLYAGQKMEHGAIASIIQHPSHPYTQGLLASRPRLDADLGEDLPAIAGNPPDLTRLPVGCPFAARCSQAEDRCWQERPAPTLHEGVTRACHRPLTTV
jgi:oligopeptide transport system ATP-binding protein